MASPLWGSLTDEELSLQADEWRYARDRHTAAGRYGLARWCSRMENEALDELNSRIAAFAAARRLGDQLCFPITGRIAPEHR